MPRLLRIHFASVGHADARLAPLTIDLRARDGSGTGSDTLLWLRNGGGKSTILNLFYSVFRPDRREFLGASAEGKARHLEDYVKADDLAFVVTEWDVEPVSDEMLFAQAPARRRLVGQALAWRDRQKSSDHSKLRKRFFSLLADARLGLEDLPIDGLGPEPVRSFDAFRAWLDDLKQQRPELESYHEDTPRRWSDHLEKIRLDPELFRYQLRMNAREGSADEAFRFRTTDEFVRFFLEIAFDTEEADRVSANLEAFRERIERRPAFLAEQAFLVDARHHLLPLRSAVEREAAAEQKQRQVHQEAATVAQALAARAERVRAVALAAAEEARTATEAATAASNDAARLGRWAVGLDRRAVELDVQEATAAHDEACRLHATAVAAVRVAEAALARDDRHRVQAERDAKVDALRVSRLEQEPLRLKVARAGTNLRARLQLAAQACQAEAEAARAKQLAEKSALQTCETERSDLATEQGTTRARIAEVEGWLAARDQARGAMRNDGLLEVREESAAALLRWQEAGHAARLAAQRHAEARDKAAQERESALAEAADCQSTLVRLDGEVGREKARLDEAVRERSRLQGLGVVRDMEHAELADLDAPGVVDRLLGEAEAAHRRTLVVAVEGAEDDRALQALDKTGRLPPAADVERAVGMLQDAGLAAFSGTEYLVANVKEQLAEHVVADPAAWHGVVVLDAQALAKARSLLGGFEPRMPVTVATASVGLPVAKADRMVLPGHPAHWDTRAGATLRDELSERKHRRQRDRSELAQREQQCRAAARDVAAWRERWGEGRLAVAESDFEQKQAAREQVTVARDAARVRADTAGQNAQQAEVERGRAETRAAAAALAEQRLRDFIDRYETDLVERRTAKDRLQERLQQIEEALAQLVQRREGHDHAYLAARDAASAADREATRLLEEHDKVDLHDADAADAVDLAGARAAWLDLRRQWQQVVSEDRLQWELGQLEDALRKAIELERTRSAGREQAVADIALGGGQPALAVALPRQEQQNDARIGASVRLQHAQAELDKLVRKRRDADDLPANEPEPATAAAARGRADQCRSERDAAYQRRDLADTAAKEQHRRSQAADVETQRCELLHKRLADAVDTALAADPIALPDSAAALDDLVDVRIHAVHDRDRELAAARKQSEALAEALRAIALDPRHDRHQSRVKERLKAPAAELADVAGELHGDIEARMEVVRDTLGQIDSDRRIVLQALDKVAMDGAHLLQAAERASRLPAGLGAWDGEPFLRIRADVPKTQPERQARLEPLLDRLVAKGTIPAGRELVDAAVRELAGQRIEATLLKPDTVRRRDRLPVTEMQTFSRGQQMTVAIVLYCTMARLRAQQRGRGHRPDAGVLLLDNPIGTVSSVPLLDLQREVARQMRVQLVYTTGVNDPDAVATFPNTVRMRNNHRARLSGDHHVTIEGLEAVRVVAT